MPLDGCIINKLPKHWLVDACAAQLQVRVILLRQGEAGQVLPAEKWSLQSVLLADLVSWKFWKSAKCSLSLKNQHIMYTNPDQRAYSLSFVQCPHLICHFYAVSSGSSALLLPALFPFQLQRRLIVCARGPDSLLYPISWPPNEMALLYSIGVPGTRPVISAWDTTNPESVEWFSPNQLFCCTVTVLPCQWWRFAWIEIDYRQDNYWRGLN